MRMRTRTMLHLFHAREDQTPVSVKIKNTRNKLLLNRHSRHILTHVKPGHHSGGIAKSGKKRERPESHGGTDEKKGTVAPRRRRKRVISNCPLQNNLQNQRVVI